VTGPSPTRAILDRLWQRGREFLGTEYAIMGGAMSWVSERHLVAAISNGGGFGVLACGSMGPALLRSEIAATQERTKKPFGVNLITMHPELDQLIDVCAERRVGHVVLAGALPPAAAIKRIQDFGAKVICFAPTVALARRMIKLGAGALVIEGSEAGGHIGPVSTSVLAQEILPEITEVPVFVAGGIGHGKAMLSFLEMGGSGVQLGTRFVCADESIAHPRFKDAFIKANARDAMPSVQVDPSFPVIPVRAIANQATKRFQEFQVETIAKVRAGQLDSKAAQLEIEHFWAGALRRAVIDGDVETGSVMAGQSVGMVSKTQSTEAILQELVAQATEALAARVQATAEPAAMARAGGTS
jgi:enoyl-[acyl-carrier protein] reductase II